MPSAEVVSRRLGAPPAVRRRIRRGALAGRQRSASTFGGLFAVKLGVENTLAVFGGIVSRCVGHEQADDRRARPAMSWWSAGHRGGVTYDPVVRRTSSSGCMNEKTKCPSQAVVCQRYAPAAEVKKQVT
jgi:hypothetical protein